MKQRQLIIALLVAVCTVSVAWWSVAEEPTKGTIQPALSLANSHPDRIQILTYNVFLRPQVAWLFRDGQMQRAALIPRYMGDADALILCEVFHNKARKRLLSGLVKAYPHRTKLPGQGSLFRTNSGLMILSRWPILTAKYHLYNECAGTDCLAQKAAIYAHIDKPGRRFHLFATHAQAHDNDNARITRTRQLQSLKRFVEQQRLPTHEPVLLGGDLNVPRHKAEYDAMRERLRLSLPTTQHGPALTFAPFQNPLAKGKRSAFIDYIFWRKGHTTPKTSTLTVLPIRSPLPWRDKLRDLSDHYAVRGTFVYPTQAP